MLSLAQARANKMKLSFTGAQTPVKPKFIGRRVFKMWTWRRSPTTSIGPFFQTWDLAGPFLRS